LTAIFAARSEPGPAMSAYTPDMSLMTPILTFLSYACARVQGRLHRLGMGQ
jgi:hypothetical protein